MTEILKTDLRVDVYTAGFTKPLVRIIHLPTNLVATCADTTSQLLNYDGAIKILKAKLAER